MVKLKRIVNLVLVEAMGHGLGRLAWSWLPGRPSSLCQNEQKICLLDPTHHVAVDEAESGCSSFPDAAFG